MTNPERANSVEQVGELNRHQTLEQATLWISAVTGFIERFKGEDTPDAAINFIINKSGITDNKETKIVHDRMLSIAILLDVQNPLGRHDGTPTSIHSLATAYMAATDPFADPKDRAAFILLCAGHDLLEDTFIGGDIQTKKDLRNGETRLVRLVGPQAAQGVAFLTRKQRVKTDYLESVDHNIYYNRLRDLTDEQILLGEGEAQRLITANGVRAAKVYDNITNLLTMKNFRRAGQLSGREIRHKYINTMKKTTEGVIPLTFGDLLLYEALNIAYDSVKKPLWVSRRRRLPIPAYQSRIS